MVDYFVDSYLALFLEADTTIGFLFFVFLLSIVAIFLVGSQSCFYWQIPHLGC